GIGSIVIVLHYSASPPFSHSSIADFLNLGCAPKMIYGKSTFINLSILEMLQRRYPASSFLFISSGVGRLKSSRRSSTTACAVWRMISDRSSLDRLIISTVLLTM